MASLQFKFIKRALIVPVALCAIIIVVMSIIAPSAIAEKESSISAASYGENVDISKYSTRQYRSFSELNADDFVGVLSSGNIPLSETAVIYNSADNLNVSLDSKSKEPWNNGGVIIRGNNTSKQLKGLYNAEIGDRIIIEFLSNGEYDYNIEKIIANVTENSIANFMENGKLVVALPYNDFSDLGNNYLYIVYVAKLV